LPYPLPGYHCTGDETRDCKKRTADSVFYLASLYVVVDAGATNVQPIWRKNLRYHCQVLVQAFLRKCTSEVLRA